MPQPRPTNPSSCQLLADIGGTHTRLALADAGVLRPDSIRRYRNDGYGAFQTLLADYLRDCALRDCAGVCLAVAGPVRGDTVRMTNLGWELTHAAIAAQTGASRVHFLNDLQAQGYALEGMAADRFCTLLPGHAAPEATTRLVVGIGTGFNAAPVHRLSDGVFVPPSECGHAHLPQRDLQARALAEWLARLHPVATVEEALSGRGLAAIHRFLGHGETTPEALVAALRDNDADARETVALYTKLLARSLADLALIHLPFGGIWLIGGTARAIGPHLAGFGLEADFRAMGRYGDLMQAFAIHLVDDDYAALSGCAAWLGARN
ncbi:MAG: glucokinase [Pararhodobacter sp.]|nr:glucokinase [Pararhodobacter sp.]